MAKITMDSQQYSDILQVTSILGIIAGMEAEKELVARFIDGANTHLDSLPPDKKTPEKRVLSLDLLVSSLRDVARERPAAGLLDIYLKRQDNPPDVSDELRTMGFTHNTDGSWTPLPSMNYRSMLEAMKAEITSRQNSQEKS